MPPKKPELYSLKKTAFWFFVASAILLVSMVAMVFQDSSRDWKVWQKKFFDLKREKIQGQLEKENKKINQKKMDAASESLKKAEEELAGKNEEILAAQNTLKELDLKRTIINQEYQALKQFQDSDRYFYEEALLHQNAHESENFQKRLEERAPMLREKELALEGLDAEMEERQAFVAGVTAEKDKAQKAIESMTRERDRLEKQIENLKPSVVKDVLNAPMLDFIHPTLQVQQHVVENLYDDYYFQKVPKVDRCTTCHLAIDQKGFEDAPQPFKTHPNLELYLTSSSAHPIEEIGCTVCHGGSGHSVNFTTAAHTPRNEEQAAAWKKDYGWHEMHHWADKMLPLNHIEASCVKCHREQNEVPGAAQLNLGKQLAQTYGCYGCHKVESSLHGTWNVGPSLEHIQSKLEPDWVVRWLHNPKEFRENTKMPRIFHLDNQQDEDAVNKDNAAIAGIAAYLDKHSEPVALEKAPAGDVDAGKKVFEEVGCMGCHSKGEIKGGSHGPELTGLGSKVNPDWLFTWLKNPKHYNPDTRMPRLRLSDKEAADVAAFLLADRNEKFESITPPHVSEESVDELALTFLTGRMRFQDAQAELSKMSFDEKLEFIGQKSINHQGCMGCHSIKGFESAGRIGTELSEHGSKEINKLDFGLTDIAHTRQDWYFNKLKNPRIFDQGKVKTYHERLRMPNFDFSDEQAEALTTYLLSLQKVYIPMEMKKNPDMRETQIEQGRLLVEKFNCAGCHAIDGKEGVLRSLADDLGNAPPNLQGEGGKVKADWLYHFLDEPTTIRPWLHYRMPSFDFSEEQLNTIVEYFRNLDEVHDSFKREAETENPQMVEHGKYLFETLQCINCHKSNPDPGMMASFLAPDLVHAKQRLQPAWVIEWMKDPQALAEGTMMPAFFPDGFSPFQDILDGDAMKQMEALRAYVWHLGHEDNGSSTPLEAAAKPAS